MTKQEEIRGRIDYIMQENIGARTIVITDKILSSLHSQGVVIKVEKELPNVKSLPTFDVPTRQVSIIVPQWWDDISMIVHLGKANQEEMLKAGYVVVEPLIKEIKCQQ